MIANIAEQALYDTELAAGDEVYLPSSGTFLNVFTFFPL
mgnify:CR=1 FL=1